MSGKKFAVGSTVFFALAIASQGIPVNAEGVVVVVPHIGQIAPSEFAHLPREDRVFVSIYGKVLEVPEGALSSEPVNASADSGTGDIAGADGQSVDQQGSSDGQGSGSGAVDAGANAAGGDYTIADAVGELSAVAEFLKSAGLTGNAEIIDKVVGKLEAIAA